MLKTDLTLIRGDTANIEFELTNEGLPVDLTGSTVYFTAKTALTNDADDSDAAITVEITNHVDPTHGLTNIPLSSEDTNVTPGTYFYDIQIKDSDGHITSIEYRQLEVIADITRRTT